MGVVNVTPFTLGGIETKLNLAFIVLILDVLPPFFFSLELLSLHSPLKLCEALVVLSF